MPENPKNTARKPARSLNDLSTETRLLLAFGLMGIVLVVSQHFLAPPPKPAPKGPASEAAQADAAPATPEPGALPAAPATVAPAAPLAPTAAEKSERFILETDVYRVVFSNRGGVVTSWTLKNYLDNNRKPVELVSPAAAAVAGWPLSYVVAKGKLPANLNDVLFKAEQPDPLSIDFVYSDGVLAARKSFRFDQRLYRFVVSSDLTLAGQGVTHLLAWRGGFGDRTVHNAPGTQSSVYYDAPNNKLVVETSDVAKNGIHSVTGRMLFAGLQDAYFAAVVLPEPGETIDFQTWQDRFALEPGADEIPHVGMAVGGKARNEFLAFVGPKDQDILKATHPRLTQLVDWGWFGFIAKPLFVFLNYLNDTVTRNWGWAIVLATVIINIVLLPLRLSSLRSSQKMAALQPQIQAINKKYAGLSIRDPRKQKQNEELMELYTKSGVNPMGGCIPLLLQMPFFFAFFKVLSTAIELRGAAWLWVPDLSQPEPGWLKLLPLIMLVSQVVMTKMTPTPTADSSQARMMMLLPILLVAMFYSASSGLVLYWTTGNLVGIVQQFFFNKWFAKPPAAAPAPPARARKT